MFAFRWISVVLVVAGCVSLVFPNAAGGANGVRPRFVGATSAGWLTFHADNSRTGWNPVETTLTTANVSQTTFGRKWTAAVDGEVYAEPLYIANLSIPNIGVHNVLYVATESDSVFAFDADSGAAIWKATFVNPAQNVTTFPTLNCKCSTILPQEGITGTPVIDVANGAIDVVAKTVEGPTGSQTTHYRLHSLLLTTGADRVPSRNITASIVASDGKTVALDPDDSMQRPALALANGNVLVSFGSPNDHSPGTTAGWIVAYNSSSLKAAGFFSTQAGHQQEQTVWYGGVYKTRMGTFWNSGAGPAIDANGYVYNQTGNGAFDGSLDWGMSFLKVAPDLSGVLDSFTPSTWQADSNNDLDLSGGGVVLLPQQTGPVPNLGIAGGKTGMTYLLNLANLGRFNATRDQIPWEGVTNNGLWGKPATYVGSDGSTYVFIPGSGPMTSWRVVPGSTPSLVKVGQTTDVFLKGEGGGGLPVISSNGTVAKSGIVWAYSRLPVGGHGNLYLRAYDASNLSNKLLSMAFTSWKGQSNLLTPMVFNGKVYTAGEGNVTAFGLLAGARKMFSGRRLR